MLSYISEFNFLLDSIVTDLPDELNDPSQNGTNDTHMLANTGHESASQRHQQLSQILSGAPTPPSSTASSAPNSSIGMSNSALNNAVKSPLTNSLTSPPHVLQNKAGPPVSSHFLQDNSNFVSSSSLSSLPNSSSTLSSMSLSSMPNSSLQNQNPMLNSMPVTSHMNVNMSHPQNQMMNGPQYSGGIRPVRGVGMPNAGNAMGPNMGMSQPNLGNPLNNPQMSRQGLDHAGLAASSQAPLMKVSHSIVFSFLI